MKCIKTLVSRVPFTLLIAAVSSLRGPAELTHLCRAVLLEADEV